MSGRLVPFLGYEDAAAAIDWLCSAFGATENAEARVESEDGTIGHAELDIEGSTIFLSTRPGTCRRAGTARAVRSSGRCTTTRG